MELGSEAPGYREIWPSDIRIIVNGHETAVYRSPGDYGARRGKLTPEDWASWSTQYGLLKTFSVRGIGSYIDDTLYSSKVRIGQLKLDEFPYISLRIAVDETAGHCGGVNLFGEKFGDYPQNIVMTVAYQGNSHQFT